MVSTQKISFSVGRKTILQETSLDFRPGLFHVIMGANGAGKSTLLKLLAGDEAPSAGTITLDNINLDEYSRKQLAIKRAVLSQHYAISFPVMVSEIVTMGRYPYFSGKPSETDLRIINASMEKMGITELMERDYQTLSGGEAQKVQMARVLSQIGNTGADNQKILFLDEPVSHLDIRFQHQLLGIARNLCRNHITVISILHDINLAMAFADRIIFMKGGRVVHDQHQPADISPEVIDAVFDVRSRKIHPDNHAPVFIF